MPEVLITGGTGMVGEAITKALLQKGYSVTVLTRDTTKTQPVEGVSYAHWDINNQIIDKDAVCRADYIIHLAGAGVADKRWTSKRKNEIVNSRVNSGKLLFQTIRQNPNKLQTIICASAIGWYGPDPQIPNPSPFKESAPYHSDYLGTTCFKWEESNRLMEQLNKRVVILRTGIVLSNKGGALAEFKKPLKLGVAAIMGSGKQIVSWIHIDDLVQLYITAIENNHSQGVYNAVAPSPVSNRNLITELAKHLKGRFYTTIAIPEFILKIVLGEMSIEVLKSATVSCEKLISNYYKFKYPTIELAIADLAQNQST